jgi:hypothetical protein
MSSITVQAPRADNVAGRCRSSYVGPASVLEALRTLLSVDAAASRRALSIASTGMVLATVMPRLIIHSCALGLAGCLHAAWARNRMAGYPARAFLAVATAEASCHVLRHL